MTIASSHKRALFTVATLATLAAGYAQPAWACAGGAPLAPVVIHDLPVTAIAPRGINQTDPAISGDLVVWWRWRGGSGVTKGDIDGKNLRTGHMFSVTTSGAVVSPPLLSRTTVVWEDCRACTVTRTAMGYLTLRHIALYGRTLPSGHEYLITRLQSAQPFPLLSGHVILWHDVAHGRDVVYGKDLQTGRVVLLQQPCGQGFPALSGHSAVWLDASASRLCVQDPWSGHASTIVVHQGDLRYARDLKLDGHIAIWTVWDANQAAQSAVIEGIDLATGRVLHVTTIPYGRFNPQLGPATALNRDIVVWEASPAAPFTNENGDIYGANVVTGQAFNITHDPHEQRSPAISGQTVVWQDLRRKNWDIYSAVLPPRLTHG